MPSAPQRQQDPPLAARSPNATCCISISRDERQPTPSLIAHRLKPPRQRGVIVVASVESQSSLTTQLPQRARLTRYQAVRVADPLTGATWSTNCRPHWNLRRKPLRFAARRFQPRCLTTRSQRSVSSRRDCHDQRSHIRQTPDGIGGVVGFLPRNPCFSALALRRPVMEAETWGTIRGVQIFPVTFLLIPAGSQSP